MDFGDLDLEWAIKVVRSHKEAIQQLAVLSPDAYESLRAKLAPERAVLASREFAEFVTMMNARAEISFDIGRRRIQCHPRLALR